MTNQFTDEQVEAGAKAYWLASEREIAGDTPVTWEWEREEREQYIWAANHVLAGVAPQAPPRINRDKLVAVIDDEAGSYEPVTSGCGYHASLKLADGSDMAERIADKVIRAALVSVQPSSTVDGITDVLGFIDKTIDNGEGGTWTWGNHEVMEMLVEIRGKVEAIGGESR